MFSRILDLYTSVTQTYPLTVYYAQGLLLSFTIWMFYLELNPRIGGIFFRPDSGGQMKFNLGGVIPMLTHPFTNLTFWKPAYWDLNFIVMSNIGAAVYTLLNGF